MKGAGRIMRPEHIIVTSNYQIADCFDNTEDVQAFERRFTVIYGRPNQDLYSILGGESNTIGIPPRAMPPPGMSQEEYAFFCSTSTGSPE